MPFRPQLTTQRNIGSQGVSLDLQNPQLPWTTLLKTLSNNNLELVNWPSDVALPGTGANDHKGISGLPTRELQRLYRAVKGPGTKSEDRLHLRAVLPEETGGLFRPDRCHTQAIAGQKRSSRFEDVSVPSTKRLRIFQYEYLGGM
jgi:hypothetical protein